MSPASSLRHEKERSCRRRLCSKASLHNVAKKLVHFGESPLHFTPSDGRAPLRRPARANRVLSARKSRCRTNVRSPLSGRNRTARSTCARFPNNPNTRLALRDLTCVGGRIFERATMEFKIGWLVPPLIEETDPSAMSTASRKL